MRQADFGQIEIRPLSSLRSCQALHPGRAEHDVLTRRHVSPEIELLEDHGDAGAVGAKLRLVGHHQVADPVLATG